MSFFKKPLILTRREVGSFVDGIFEQGASSQITIHASVQPISSQDRAVLPEGIRENSRYVLFTSDSVRSSNKDTKLPPDEIEIDDRQYTVLLVESWANGLIEHRRVVAGVNP